MKKSLILSAALFAAFGANAEVYTYDFNKTPEFFKLLQLPESEDGLGWTGNYDLIYKDGTTKNTDGEAMIYKPEGAEKGIARANRLISLYDGQTYLFTEEANSYDYPVADETILSQPFLSWGCRDGDLKTHGKIKPIMRQPKQTGYQPNMLSNLVVSVP